MTTAQLEAILGADRQRTAGIVSDAAEELETCRVTHDWAASLNKGSP